MQLTGHILSTARMFLMPMFYTEWPRLACDYAVGDGFSQTTC